LKNKAALFVNLAITTNSMGYFAGHKNWEEFAEWHGITRRCEYCGQEFTPRSPNQRKHSWVDYQEYNIDCVLQRELDEMSPSTYLRHVGMTKKKYIKEYGIEQYNLVVLQKTSTNPNEIFRSA
jgi:hypothetical protein